MSHELPNAAEALARVVQTRDGARDRARKLFALLPHPLYSTAERELIRQAATLLMKAVTLLDRAAAPHGAPRAPSSPQESLPLGDWKPPTNPHEQF